MNYSEIKYHDIANGLGVRVSLFVSGCTLHCKGCFNRIAWDFNNGEEYTQEVENKIFDEISKTEYKGLSILGGDPFEKENLKSVYSIVNNFRERFGDTKDIWIWTGRILPELIRGNVLLDETDYYRRGILRRVNYIVDGKFMEDAKDISLKFRGSSNQRIYEVRKLPEDNDYYGIPLFLKNEEGSETVKMITDVTPWIDKL